MTPSRATVVSQDPESVVAHVRKSVVALGDPDRAARVRRSVPGANTNGAAVPALRALARALPAARTNDGFAGVCEVMDALCRTGSRELMLVGVFYLGRHQRLVSSLSWRRIAPWVAAVDNWETCDQLSAEVIATVLSAHPVLAKALITLARSPNPWRRRVAVATAASLWQRGRRQPAISDRICAALEGDREPMIRRAVAWARREAAKAR